MRLLLFLVLAISTAAAQSQKQTTPNKQGSQEQVQKSSANQNVTDVIQQKPEAVVTQARPAEGQVHADTPKKNDWPQTVKEINDTLLVIFTGVLAYVGYLQWKTLRNHEKWMKRNVAIAKQTADAAKKSADVADLALRSAERAEITLESCGVLGELMNGADCRVILEFKNSGRTAAQYVRLALNVVAEGVPETSNENIPSITIGAGMTANISSQQFGDFLTKDMAIAVLTGRNPLRFIGEVAYKDVFGYSHTFKTAGTYDLRSRHFHIDSQESE